jgi:4-amino-4-deoxy-L-arabinose transferase-like glycosyltransferase
MRAAMTPTRAAATALGIVLLATLLTPSRRELFCGDETKYSEVVREMRATGEWFLPPLEGVPFTHKPPLHFWTVALLTFAFGTYSTWSYVLPSLLALLFLTWLMWRMGGAIAAFVCATSVLVWGSAQTARMDVSFTAFITLAVWMMSRSLRFEVRDANEEERDRGNADRSPLPSNVEPRTSRSTFLTIAGLSLAIATLLKGPMAPVIVIVLFALECWRHHKLPKANYFPGVAAMVVIPLLWFIPAMRMGGGAYTHEVLQKQLAGRAIGAWVHQSPPWFYLLHSPGFLFPWFGALVAALASRWREERFNINWILAVLLPYSLMSSKLDVYMMALIPPVALIVANALRKEKGAGETPALHVDGEEPARLPLPSGEGAAKRRVRGEQDTALIPGAQRGITLANIITLAVLLLAAVAGPFVNIKGAPPLTPIVVVLAIASAVALVVAFRGAFASTIALGLVPAALFAFVAIAMMPEVNQLASGKPLVDTLASLHVPADQIALYTAPHLWTHDMPRDLEHVHYVSPQSLAAMHPTLVVTPRKHAAEIAPQLAGYHVVRTVQLIGKPFDVYAK